MPLLSQAELRDIVTCLAGIYRPSASAGEREAAELIAGELEAAGAPSRIELEDAHGTYWWPIGVLTGVSALAGASRSRLARVGVGLAAAAAAADDISGGRLWFRRHFLPRRKAANVVAEAGDPEAEQTVVITAHHDAAHSGLVFHPELARLALRRSPWLLERTDTTPPAMWGAVAAPLVVALGGALGSRRLARAGAAVAAGYVAAMVDIGARRAVQGANDNLSGVAAVVSLARSLGDDPLEGLRVIFVSTGSEESFLEGMQGFARRHFAVLPAERTRFICLDTVGSPHLLALEGEGMLWMNEYPKEFLQTFKDAAEQLGVFLFPNLRLRNATDGLIPLRAGYPTVTLGSVDEFKIPTHYHWPSDTPDNVNYGTVTDCARLVRGVLERLAKPLEVRPTSSDTKLEDGPLEPAGAPEVPVQAQADDGHHG